MNGFRRWFSNIMIGRYGMDELNRFLMYLSLAFIIINILLGWRILRILIVLMLIVLYARMFSRSIYSRQKENQKFLQLKAKFSSGKKGRSNQGGGFRKQNDGRRVLICPYCKEKLRVPVGAGTIRIRCPHCQREFEETV